MNQKMVLFRQKFQSLPIDERKAFLKNLNTAQRLALYSYPEFFLFDKQIITGDQRYTILRCGRSFGKSFTGSAWIARKVLDGAKDLGLVGPTISDVENVMVKALIKWFPPNKARYIGGDKKVIKFVDYPETTVYCYSADTEIRGPNIEYLWCDEIVKWNDSIADKVKETFETADYAVRVGQNPQTLITSTPKPFPLFIKWQQKIDEGNPLYKMYTGTMFDNPFLSNSYKQAMVDEYGNSRHGRQELYGELLTEVEGAAWTQKMIEDGRITMSQLKAKLNASPTSYLNEKGYTVYNKKFELFSGVTAVDPTVSDNPDGDECGIVTAVLGSDGHVYVVGDNSGQYTTLQWAKEAAKAYHYYDSGRIVIEKNNGGELVSKNIKSVDSSIPIKAITATKGKIDRALPIAALYEKGIVHHVMPDHEVGKPVPENPYSKLEGQMTRYTGNPKEKSPDRLDALVWAIYELKLSHNHINRDVDAIGYF